MKRKESAKGGAGLLLMVAALAGGCVVAPPPPPPPAGVVMPGPDHGVIIATLPPHARPVIHRGQRAWVSDGRYYRAVHGGYTVWVP